MAFSNAITEFVRSIYEAITGAFGLVYHMLHGAIATVVHLFTSFFELIADTLNSVIALVGGVGKFITGECLYTSLCFRHASLIRQETLCSWPSSSLLRSSTCSGSSSRAGSRRRSRLSRRMGTAQLAR